MTEQKFSSLVTRSNPLLCSYILGILNGDGRRLVAAIVREGRKLYPPGTERLKDIVTNYKCLTGSDKWLLGSLMLLVFQSLLVRVNAMVRGTGRTLDCNGVQYGLIRVIGP